MRALLLNKTIGGILLVAGVTIGAGMLALPITTGLDGFRSAALLMIAVYLFMLFSLFVLLEVSLYLDDPSGNVISSAKKFLGPWGQLLAWTSFLLLFYSVSAAYISGGGSLMARALVLMNWPYASETFGVIIFILLFGGIVFVGTQVVDVINKILMFTLITAFLFLAFFMSPHVTLENIRYTGTHQYYVLATLPIAILSFTSHVVLPSLRQYLNNNVSQLKKVLIWGSLLPLLCYLVWDFLILGIFPVEGAFSLAALAKAEHPVQQMTVMLQENFDLPSIALGVGVFSFCALVTSFLAVMLSLMDFMADGLKIQKTSRGRLILAACSMLPPILFALFFPHAFLTALGYAGIFIAILYGILPAWMAWRVRYVLKYSTPYRAPLGKIGLFILFAGAVFIIGLDLLTTLKFVQFG